MISKLRVHYNVVFYIYFWEFIFTGSSVIVILSYSDLTSVHSYQSSLYANYTFFSLNFFFFFWGGYLKRQRLVWFVRRRFVFFSSHHRRFYTTSRGRNISPWVSLRPSMKTAYSVSITWKPQRGIRTLR